MPLGDVGRAEQNGGPAHIARLSGHTGTRIGFISPISQHVCDTCSRVRMTAEGRLLLCLGHEHSLGLRGLLRRYPGEDAPMLDALLRKPARHFLGSDEVQVLRIDE